MVINDLDSDMSPVENPAEGLLIFNTGSVAAPAGFYAWDGSEWVMIMSSKNPQVMGSFDSEAGELYEDNTNGTPSMISLDQGDVYYGWVTAVQSVVLGSVTTNTANATADQIIVGEDGVYEVILTISQQEHSSNGHGEIIIISVFKTPNGGSSVATHIKFRSDESYERSANGSSQGLLPLNAGDAVDVRFISDENDTELDLYHISLTVKKIGDL